MKERASALGVSHAEAQDRGELYPKIYSGKQVADALNIRDELTVDEYAALWQAYTDGRAGCW